MIAVNDAIAGRSPTGLPKEPHSQRVKTPRRAPQASTQKSHNPLIIPVLQVTDLHREKAA